MGCCRVYGPIPLGTTLDHVCNVTLCQRPDQLEPVTKPKKHAAGGTSARHAALEGETDAGAYRVLLATSP